MPFPEDEEDTKRGWMDYGEIIPDVNTPWWHDPEEYKDYSDELEEDEEEEYKDYSDELEEDEEEE